MRVIICGGRDYEDYDAVARELTIYIGGDRDAIVIQGGANGADSLASLWCRENGVRCDTYYARWDLHGGRAGPIRNQRMIDEGRPNFVIAFPRANGEWGNGTRDMVRRARAAGIEVREIEG